MEIDVIDMNLNDIGFTKRIDSARNNRGYRIYRSQGVKISKCIGIF